MKVFTAVHKAFRMDYWWKNFTNRWTFAKVMTKHEMSCSLLTMYCKSQQHGRSVKTWWTERDGNEAHLLRSRSRSGSLRSSSDTSATTSEIFIRSSTASSRSLMASGLHRGAHSQCFSNRLPAHTATFLHTQPPSWTDSRLPAQTHSRLPACIAAFLYECAQALSCKHRRLPARTTSLARSSGASKVQTRDDGLHGKAPSYLTNCCTSISQTLPHGVICVLPVVVNYSSLDTISPHMVVGLFLSRVRLPWTA